MDRNYNRRSGSSDLNNRSARPVPRSRSASQRTGSTQTSAGRDKVDYNQTARNNYSAQIPRDDPRMRYAKYRSDKPLRVLGDPEETRQRSRQIIGDDYDRVAQGGTSRRTSGRELQGTTVREYRQRQREASRHRSKTPGRLFVLGLALVVLVAAGFALYQSPAFAIENITVKGSERLTDEYLTELAAVSKGSTLLRADMGAIKKRIEADKWVESASIHRSFPGTLVITVKERRVAAIVEFPSLDKDGQTLYWLISNDGVWLGAYDPRAIFAAEAAFNAGGEVGVGTGASGAAGDNAGAGDTDASAADDGAGAPDTDAGAVGDGDDAPDAGDDADDADDAGADAGAGADDPAAAVETQAPEQTTATDIQGDDMLGGPSVINGALSIFTNVLVTPEEVKSVVRFKDIAKSAYPKAGSVVTDEGILNALEIINQASPRLLEILQSISAPDKVKTTLTLTNNVAVAFGVAESVDAKEKVILTLLAEHEGKIISINVRVADRPSYRAAS